jgi:hypothetical protein
LNELLGITAMNLPHLRRVLADSAMLPTPSLKKPCDRKHSSCDGTPDRTLRCRVSQVMAFEQLRDANDYECSSEHRKKASGPEF